MPLHRCLPALACALAAALALAACGAPSAPPLLTGATRTADPPSQETPRAATASSRPDTVTTATAVAAPATLGGATATPAPQASRNSLNLPGLILQSGSAEETGAYGSYYWQRSDGLVADVKSDAFALPTPPLSVNAGSSLHFRFSSGPAPEKLELSVYPKDGNIQDRTDNQGNKVKVFQPRTAPQASGITVAADLIWAPSLPAGDYFVVAVATWPNTRAPDKPFHAAYAFEVDIAP